MDDDEQAGFSITKVEYVPPRPVVHMVTSNNVLVMALDNGKLIRLDLRDTSDLRDIDVGPAVRKLFLDPTGNHLIISTVEDTQYLHRSWDKPKPLKLMKNFVVTSVGWDLDNTESQSTNHILLGTATGAIYEVYIEAVQSMLKSMERGLRLLYTFPDQETHKLNASSSQSGPLPPNPISLDGLGWFRVPGGRLTKYCIFACSGSRLWQFVGVNTFEQVFSNYATLPPYGVYHHVSTEPGSLKSVELHFYHKFLDQQTIYPKSMGWFMAPNGPGQMEGAWMANFSFAGVASSSLLMDPSSSPNAPSILNPSGSNSGFAGSGFGSNNTANNLENVIDSFKHVPFSDRPSDAISVSMVLTEFHYIILYQNGLIQFISRLNNEVVFEGKCSVGKFPMRGLAHDPRTQITFAYTENQLFEIHIEQEDKNVWKMYLRNGQYEMAERYAREDWQRDQVWIAQADHHFNQKLYKMAAELYARTSRSFEEVTLKFIHENEHSALRSFLKEKLARMSFQKEAMQPTIICTWLTELYLSKLNELEAQQIEFGMNSGRSSNQVLGGSFAVLQEEFRSFLAERKQYLDKVTTFNLISSYGRVDELLEYAKLVEAYDTIVGFHMQQQNYVSALQEMRSWKKADMFYKYCPILMQNEPELCATVLMEMPPNLLNPRLLIPALMRYQSTRNNPSSSKFGSYQQQYRSPNSTSDTNQAIRYLKYCVEDLGNQDSAVHNFLISLYAEQEGGEQNLLDFLNRPSTYFDLEYALRLCEKHNKVTAQVWIYSKMGLPEEAVSLALTANNVELAKQNADSVHDVDLRKKLWLKIARHMIEGDRDHDISKAMKFLGQSDLLKIEDILPFFPDFVVINDFKAEICRSLQEYNRHIEDLKLEIEESTNAAQAIRSDIDKLSNKYGSIASNQTCEFCKSAILSKSFYLFPCSHLYHQNCLIEYLKPLIIDSKVKSRILAIVDELRTRRMIAYQASRVDRDSPMPTSSSGISSFFESNKDGALSSLLANTPLASLNLPFGTNQQQQLQQQQTSPNNPAKATAYTVSSSSEKQLQEELDKYVGRECPLCGDSMIESVAQPLVDPKSTASWDFGVFERRSM